MQTSLTLDHWFWAEALIHSLLSMHRGLLPLSVWAAAELSTSPGSSSAPLLALTHLALAAKCHFPAYGAWTSLVQRAGTRGQGPGKLGDSWSIPSPLPAVGAVHRAASGDPCGGPELLSRSICPANTCPLLQSSPKPLCPLPSHCGQSPHRPILPISAEAGVKCLFIY